MADAAGRPRSSSPYAVESMAVKFSRSRLGACWRWRTELSAVLLSGGVFGWAWDLCGSWVWPLVILAVIVVAAGAVPWSRRAVLGRVHALFTRHRLQRAFWELRLHTRAGRLPLVLRIAVTVAGVRVFVLIRAGMTFADFEDSGPAFAAACGAREARVSCSARWSWLVIIDVICRDVLGPSRVIASPLAAVPGSARDGDRGEDWS